MMRVEVHELTLFNFLINFRGLEAYVQKTIYNFLIVSCLLIRNQNTLTLCPFQMKRRELPRRNEEVNN
jgi:hypothetical protein